MKNFIVASLLLLQSLTSNAEIIDIDTSTFARLLEQRVPLIDVRTTQEWEESGIVAGSHLITYFDSSGKADPTAWLERVRTIAKPGEPVILICRSGNRTRAVSRFLSDQAGYSKVYAVKGGIQAWAGAGKPLVPVPTQAVATCRANRRC